MAALEDLKTKTAELLDDGLRSGALTPEDHSWRSGHLAQADSVEALEALVEDLLAPRPETSSLALARASELNLMSQRTFTVHDLGRRSELATIMGSTRLDLGGLDPSEPLSLELAVIMGDAVIVVPNGVKVRFECTAVMADAQVDPSLRSADAPVRISGVVVMGSIRVIPAQAPAVR